MNNTYKNIFSPLKVNSMTLKNRIAMSPMGTNFAKSNGEMSDEHIEYYRLRAAGGVGLIIVENVSVDSPSGDNGTTQLKLHHDSFIPMLYKFNETIHRYGCCTSVQLNHGGCKSKAVRNGVCTVAPSGIKSVDGSLSHELTSEEIADLAVKYGQAARRAKIAGFDSVEIHAGHGYLINQFLSEQWNHRSDEFGGSLEKRTRFCRMVIDEVRKAVGPDYPVLMRVSLDEMVKGGNTIEDSLKQLELLTEGVDLVETSIGGKYTMDAPEHPDGWRAFVARSFKEKFDIPCGVMGNIREPQVAESILERGDADLIVIGRGLIADPDWVNKVQSGQEECIRPCLSCNIGCVGHRIESNTPIRCAVNPSVTSEEWHKLNKVKKDCNVLVIGGGMSGLETACTAAETGCRVTLLEESDELGGWVRKISQLPLKFRMKRLLNYMLNRAESLKNLTCLTGVKVTNNLIDAFKPDIVAWCIGSEPILPPIPGLREAVSNPTNTVYDVKGFLDNFPTSGNIVCGKEIAIAGGGWVALDVGEFFAESGNHITIIEMQNDVGIEMDRYNRQHAGDWLTENKATVLTGHKVLSVSDNEFVVSCNDEQKSIHFDYGFVCLGLKSKPENDAIKEHLANRNIPFITIGDGKRARRIYEGVHEGREIVQQLRVMGFYD